MRNYDDYEAWKAVSLAAPLGGMVIGTAGGRGDLPRSDLTAQLLKGECAMLKSGKAYVKTTPDPAGHIPDEIKTHAEQKAKIVPNENKTHSEGDEVCRIVPGKGNTNKDSAPPDGGLTLDNGVPKKIVPPSHKAEGKVYS